MDEYEDERRAREIDKFHMDREKNQIYCLSCKTWISKYIPHGCKEVSNGKS